MNLTYTGVRLLGFLLSATLRARMTRTIPAMALLTPMRS